MKYLASTLLEVSDNNTDKVDTTTGINLVELIIDNFTLFFC